MCVVTALPQRLSIVYTFFEFIVLPSTRSCLFISSSHPPNKPLSFIRHFHNILKTGFMACGSV